MVLLQSSFLLNFGFFCGLKCERRLRIRLLQGLWSALAPLAWLRRKHMERYWLQMIGFIANFCKRLSQRAFEEVQEQNVPKHKAEPLFTHSMPHSLVTLTKILYRNHQKELFKTIISVIKNEKAKGYMTTFVAFNPYYKIG